MTSKQTIPKAPKGAAAAGARLWRSVVSEYELEEHEAVLLREAVRLTDLLDELHERAALDGSTILGPDGAPRTHPAVVEARQSRIALARVVAALRLPAGDEGDQLRRPQKRQGVRGVYALGRNERARSVS